MRTHTREKPFKCTHCGAAFSQSGILNEHLRIHFGKNIYKCNECTETFQYFRDFDDHRNQHFINNKLINKNV